MQSAFQEEMGKITKLEGEVRNKYKEEKKASEEDGAQKIPKRLAVPKDRPMQAGKKPPTRQLKAKQQDVVKEAKTQPEAKAQPAAKAQPEAAKERLWATAKRNDVGKAAVAGELSSAQSKLSVNTEKASTAGIFSGEEEPANSKAVQTLVPLRDKLETVIRQIGKSVGIKDPAGKKMELNFLNELIGAFQSRENSRLTAMDVLKSVNKNYDVAAIVKSDPSLKEKLVSIAGSEEKLQQIISPQVNVYRR